MDKLKMHSVDKVDENIKKIGALFPNCVTERKNDKGEVEYAIDFDMLRQELSVVVVEGNEERYQFTWPDKKKSVLLANAPISDTLRPCREESVDFDTTENLYIEGDNLAVLKLLQETYLHSIDVIYIDPPYNTGVNLIYHNDFHQSVSEYLSHSGQYDEEGNMLVKNPITNGRYHTDWLNMIIPRVRLAKDLLSENGILVLTIDDYEIQTITMVLNEVFGEENHLATIIIKNNPSGRSTVTGASISHEYALFYAANTSVKLGRLPRNDKQIARYKEKDTVGAFEWVNFRKHGGYKEDAPSMFYPIFIKKDGSDFRIPAMSWDETLKEYKLLEEPAENEEISLPIDENGRERRWKWSLERACVSKSEMSIRKDRDDNFAVYIKSRMKEEGMLPLTVWDDKKYSSTEYGTNLLINLFGERYFDYPKSLYAVEDCIRIASEKSDARVLDFFSGSATTAHAIMQMNSIDGGRRQFIMVQVPERVDASSAAYKAGYKNICEIGKERIRRAGAKIKEEAGLTGEGLDIGFRVLKLDSSNMKDVYYTPDAFAEDLFDTLADNIKEDRTPEDLLFQVMLDLGILLSSKIEESVIADKKVFNVAPCIPTMTETLSLALMKESPRRLSPPLQSRSPTTL